MATIVEVVTSKKRGSSFSPTVKNASLAVKNAAMTAKYAAAERLCETLQRALKLILAFCAGQYHADSIQRLDQRALKPIFG